MKTHQITPHDMTWHLATNHITSPHVTSQPAAVLHRSLQPTTSKQVTTSPPWNGWRLVHSKNSVWASQWLVTLCTFYRQILSLTYSFFFVETSAPGLPGPTCTTSDVSYIFLIVLDTYFQGSLYSDPHFSSLDMDFFEPVGDKDWMVNLGVGSYIYLEYTSGKLATQCLGFLVSLVCLVAKGENQILCLFLGVWYNLWWSTKTWKV